MEFTLMNKSTESYPEINELKEDLASLKKHVSELTAALKKDGYEEADRLGAKAREKLDELKGRGHEGLHHIEDHVRQKPGQSIAIAFAVGFLASLLLRNRG
ncbi:MAG: hypothetical protein CMN55_06595 [Sneathiella sp.]|jgi:ElaB/YqjD/DUF883 family membrane-anchored ribosome-binding protein|nr:hypothetical protein [Sneathiella sp.]|tara:strand:- start:382 stop:684 length:303 start_codon:yes stop_codon:yes gene_type:complete